MVATRDSPSILTAALVTSSFDHLVGAPQERSRDHQAKRPGGGQIHDEIEPGRLLDRDVARLRATQNLVDIVTGAAEQVGKICSIVCQASGCDVLSITEHRR